MTKVSGAMKIYVHIDRGISYDSISMILYHWRYLFHVLLFELNSKMLTELIYWTASDFAECRLNLLPLVVFAIKKLLV